MSAWEAGQADSAGVRRLNQPASINNFVSPEAPQRPAPSPMSVSSDAALAAPAGGGSASAGSGAAGGSQDSGGVAFSPVTQVESRVQEETWQQKILLTLEEPSYSLLAQVVSYLILITICISILSFVLEAEPELADFGGWWYIEIISTVVFTIEYLLRFAVCNAFGGKPTRCEFLRDPMNFMDLIAILPFYVEISLSSLELGAFRVLRSVRLIRIFRIFRLSKYSMGMALMVQSLIASIQPLMILGFFLCIGVTLSSSLLYYAERMYCPNMATISKDEFDQHVQECFNHDFDTQGRRCCDKWGSAHDFISIMDTTWWSIVTMTTVGYGDKAPKTTLGQFIGAMTMLLGIVLISLPVAIVGSKFQSAYEAAELEHERLIMAEKDRKAMEAQKKIKDGGPDTAQQAAQKFWLGAKVRSSNDAEGEKDQLATGSQASASSEHVVSEKAIEKDKQTPTPLPRSASKRSASAVSAVSSPRPHHPESAKDVQDHTPSTLEKAEILKQNLQRLDRRTTLSGAAREQIKLILALLEHISVTEGKLSKLREKDAAMEACIAQLFTSLCRNYESRRQETVRHGKSGGSTLQER